MRITEPYIKRLSALRTERTGWENDWRNVQRVLLPMSGRFFDEQNNKGNKKSRRNEIYDSTGTKALRTLQAGMMSGMTSPARPWFRLDAPDPDMNEFGPVKTWLHIVTRNMLDVFNKSNIYRALHSCYGELGAYGTHPVIIIENDRHVIHAVNSTAGEYCLGANHLGAIDTIYREFRMTVGQLVGRFGYNACSTETRRAFDQGNVDRWVDVVHAIEPRIERDPRKQDRSNMAIKSVYFEKGCSDNRVLSEGGFEENPLMGPRWEVLPGDVYGTGPGIDALGDIRQLQHEQLRKAQAIDKMTNPPLQGPAEMQSMAVDGLPGGITFVPGLTGERGGLRPLYDVNLNLSYLLEDIRDVRDRINQVFYADLFAMLSMSDRRQITATEVAERHEEKLLLLGPVLERLQGELLAPLIDRTFAIMLRRGLIPEPPRELQNHDLQVQYISMLAQAQRAVGTQSIDRLTGFVMTAAQVNPEVIDKLDFDQAIDDYSAMLGTPPQVVRADDDVALIRERRLQQQQQAQQMAQLQQAADSAKTMSETSVEDRSALTSMFTGL